MTTDALEDAFEILRSGPMPEQALARWALPIVDGSTWLERFAEDMLANDPQPIDWLGWRFDLSEDLPQ